ncbi:hypothetical protein LOK49_Contig14G00009 [Camellia lanceoleosa]|nr:hypothetical protein LOK49_Contig14G00009 [Camellia lanceoleosa]
MEKKKKKRVVKKKMEKMEDAEEKKKTREKDKRVRGSRRASIEGAAFVGQPTQKQSPRAKRGKRRGRVAYVYMYIYCIAM